MRGRVAENLLRVVASIVCVSVLSCSRNDSAPSPSTTIAPITSSASPDSVNGPLAPTNTVRFISAPQGDVAKIVRDELGRAKTEGRQLLVYVGATWCEPCQRFHHAANRGDLDRDFSTLTLLEFDLDRDGERLTASGYRSQYIPLFVLPKNDGTASEHRMEGSVKGDGAVAEITPRLRALLKSGGQSGL
jgi:thiol-disulfide isomerase/thioredoxin